MRVLIVLTRREIDALGRLASIERRPPRDQAAFLIAEGLRTRGLLPGSDPPCTQHEGAIESVPAPGTSGGVADVID
jgi:hypothetical protein